MRATLLLRCGAITVSKARHTIFISRKRQVIAVLSEEEFNCIIKAFSQRLPSNLFN